VIVGNLIGGLGNQMFQWACTRAVALDTGLPLRVATDQFSGYALRALELQRVFALELPVASRDELRGLIGAWRAPLAVRRAIGKLGSETAAGRRFVLERHVQPGPGLAQRAERGAYLHGYWQSERWFAHHAAAVRADFAWRQPLSERSAEVARRIAADGQAISLHVRRGDYVSEAKNRSIYALCEPAYYEAAVARLRQAGAGRVFAFSDDPAWVAGELAPRLGDVEIVDHNRGADSPQDMRLMAACRHHVIANSSFSWWGAWLDPRPDKRVIAPARWFADGRDESALLPAAWQRL
jgi:hypothetical protein